MLVQPAVTVGASLYGFVPYIRSIISPVAAEAGIIGVRLDMPLTYAPALRIETAALTSF